MSAGAAGPAGAAGAGRIYVTDCEGPLTRNDNAQEIAERFIPEGAEFFARISRYDDFLADVLRKPGYNAGDTLRLVPPFFKAFYVTDEDVELFSAERVLLVPQALKTLDAVSALMPVYIISTSYTPYLRALCDIAGFDMAHVRCTELSLDAWEMPEEEAAWLRSAVDAVLARPVIEIPDGASSAADLSPRDRATVAELDDLFWGWMADKVAGEMLAAVRPVGGGMKLEALEQIRAAEGVEGGGVMYVGDSITDAPPLEAVKAWGGVSLSFNGNGYAIAAAEFAAASPDAEVQAQ
ncbi:MAG: hypothetical protein GX624_02595, partial [Actinobacteria bacterium]|nr:hypothetical protein [Actinomycetota bacterium]